MSWQSMLLIRHGRQNSSLCNVDVELAEAGVQQAALLGARLQETAIAHVYSSDMIRAVQTADIMNRSINAPRSIDARIRELNFGEMEGLTEAEINERFGAFTSEIAAGDIDLRYPGGETGKDVEDRALPALQAIAKTHCGADGVIVIVTHGVVIRTLVCAALGTPTSHWRRVAPVLENCSITEISVNPTTARMRLERLNDYAHLSEHPQLLRAAWGVAEN